MLPHADADACVVQAKSVLPAGSIVSALIIEDLGKMPIPEVPQETPGLSSS